METYQLIGCRSRNNFYLVDCHFIQHILLTVVPEYCRQYALDTIEITSFTIKTKYYTVRQLLI